MAQVRLTMIDLLGTELEEISGINAATRIVPDLPKRENMMPYITIVAGDEVTQVVDADNVRYLMAVELVLFTGERYSGVEELIVLIKNKLLAPISLGTNCLGTELVSVAGPEVWESQGTSSARFTLAVIYWAPKVTN